MGIQLLEGATYSAPEWLGTMNTELTGLVNSIIPIAVGLFVVVFGFIFGLKFFKKGVNKVG